MLSKQIISHNSNHAMLCKSSRTTVTSLHCHYSKKMLPPNKAVTNEALIRTNVFAPPPMLDAALVSPFGVDVAPGGLDVAVVVGRLVLTPCPPTPETAD